jgi:hypothetical protein
MANEFIARKGLIALENSQITGSLNVSGTLSIPGFTNVSASLAAATAGGGTITGVTAGSGLSGGGSSGGVTVNVDYGSGTIITDAGAFNTGGTSAANDLLLVHHNDDSEAQKVGITAFMDEYKIVNRTGTPVDNDYAKFTDANTIEGRSFSEVKTDLSLGNVTNESKATMFTSPTFTGNVTASSNISASGNIIGNKITSSGAVNIGGILSIPGFSNVSASLAAAVAGGDNLGNHTATQDLNLDNNSIKNLLNISASGGISSSGKVTSDTLDVDGFISLGGVDSIVNNSGTITFGNNSNVTQIRSSEAISIPSITTANITASSNISSSGTGSFAHLNLPGFNFDSEASTTELIVEGNITASGDISSSGTIVMLTASIGGGIFTSASLAGGGGGGSSTLAGLSDVNFSSLANSDLIQYNSTAGEWQNTNLGLTVTPIISFADISFVSGEITITNSASYDDPSIFCQIKSGSTVVVPNSSMSFNEATGKITYEDVETEASRSIELRVQDFGDLQSELVTGSYMKKDTNFRYWRLIYNAESSNSHTYLKNFRLFDDVNQSGNAYPDNMTSNVLPSPYSASGNYKYNSTYDYFKAFDSSTASSGWWTIGSNTKGKFINIDFGTAQNIKSVKIRFNQSYYVATNLSVIGSNNADYSDSVALIDSASVVTTETPTLAIVIN